jgi:hypothetical protein
MPGEESRAGMGGRACVHMPLDILIVCAVGLESQHGGDNTSPLLSSQCGLILPAPSHHFRPFQFNDLLQSEERNFTATWTGRQILRRLSSGKKGLQNVTQCGWLVSSVCLIFEVPPLINNNLLTRMWHGAT